MAKVLVIGGTRFFGKKLVRKLINIGDEVSVMTRTHLPEEFKGKVSHLQCDRTIIEDFKTAIGNQFFDIVYDNINYSSLDALQSIALFTDKTARYIFTSTLSVHYPDGIGKNESDFDSITYPIIEGNSSQFDYGEGKRQAEAVFFQKATFPVVAVRFPIVLGADDYTKRLHFHVEHVQQQKEIAFENIKAQMCFITSDEAASFLFWTGREIFTGPIQAASNGIISMQDLMTMIEEKTSQKAIISHSTNEKELSPFSIPKTWYINNSLATSLGFKFSELDNWLPKLILEIK